MHATQTKRILSNVYYYVHSYCTMKIIYILFVCILFASCQKEESPAHGEEFISGPYLKAVKAVFNGESIIQNEFEYHTDGRIKTAIVYKDNNKSIVSNKRAYSYENNRISSIEIQTDFSSASTAVNYSYGKTAFEYNSEHLIIQSNHFVKKSNEYELTSFITYTYNEKKLPVKLSRYLAGGLLYGYSTYAYDGNGNVVLLEDFAINSSSNPVKSWQHTNQYDDKNNPYRTSYNTLENIPYSVNRNNIISSTSINYTTDPQGTINTSTTKYNKYNSAGYPTIMDEQGNIFEFEYK